jgi:hypothetical protein
MKRPPLSERSDWTEQDLLTREEASGRLKEEIVEVSTRLGRLGEPDQAERELLGTRLRALREVLDSLAES